MIILNDDTIQAFANLNKGQQKMLLEDFGVDGMDSYLPQPTTSRTRLSVYLKLVKDNFITSENEFGHLTDIGCYFVRMAEEGLPIAARKPFKGDIKPMDELRGWLVDNVTGEGKYFSDGIVMLKGFPPENSFVSKNKEDFERVCAIVTGHEIKPVGFTIKEGETLLWFDNQVHVEAKYFDFINKRFPGTVFKESKDKNSPIKLYDNKDRFIGLLMSNHRFGSYETPVGIVEEIELLKELVK